jgi:hypothetical protein
MRVFNRTRKVIRYFLLLLPIAVGLLSFSTDPQLHAILKKMQAYHKAYPQEKLYLHFDKPFYAAGDSIWFKAYLVEASLHNLDSQSRVIYAELIDSAHRVIQRRILYAAHGLAHGDFYLKTDLHQGKYLIRAYTNYMKNTGEDFFFLKEFQVLNPAKDYTQFESLQLFEPDSIDLQFFAEGGNLVSCGKLNRLAFKAVSPDGKSLSAEGYITDDRDSIITGFRAEHDGMGVISFIPKAGRKYYAQIRKPYEVKRLYELPEVRQNGITLQVNKTNKYVKVMIYSTPALANQDIHLVVQSRGKVYYAQSGSIKAQAWFIYIPCDKLPHGISHITVFDSFGRPVAERLVYQNHHESITISIKTDTITYGARQPVIVYADAFYQNGVPARGSFSVSVYDDKLLTSPDQYPITIDNYLSLTSDLKGNIENPGYYFKDTLNVTEKHLDLLMMVHGWQRFTWQDVLDDNQQPQLFAREKGIPIGGRVTKAWKDKLVQGSTLKLLSMTGQATVLKPDSLGNFYTDALLFYDTIDLVARTEDAKGKRQPYKFRLKPISFPAVSYPISAYTQFDASQYVKQQNEQRTLLKLSDVTQLQEFVVVAKRQMLKKQFNPWGHVTDMRKKRYQYNSIYELLADNVKGLTFTGEPPTIKARLNGKPPILMINGENKILGSDLGTHSAVPAGFSDDIYPFAGIAILEAEDVDMIETSKTFTVSSKYPQDVINIMLKPGSYDVDIMGMNQVKYAGFYNAREFYSPRYDAAPQRQLPDKRTTLYWEPMLETDEHGKVAVSFYTADVASRYRIVIEGITADGYPGTASATFEVK